MTHQFDTNDLKHAEERINGIVGWLPDVRGEKGKINPHMTRFVNKNNQFVDVFHVKPIYYETLSGHWRPLSEVTSYHGNRKLAFTLSGLSKVHPRYINWLEKRMEILNGVIEVESPWGDKVLSPYMKYAHDLVTLPKLGLTVLTAYPDPHPETTTFDSRLEKTGTGAYPGRFDTAHDATTSDDALDNLTSHNVRYDDRGASTGFTIDRIQEGFDTSSISTDNIDSAVHSAYCTGIPIDDYSPDGVAIVSQTVASTTSGTTSDYDNYGATDYSSTTAPSATAWHDLTLNASGEAYINKTGVTWFMRMHEQDLADTATENNRTVFSYDAADKSGTSTDPKLVVTHSAGAAFTPKVIMF